MTVLDDSLWPPLRRSPMAAFEVFTEAYCQARDESGERQPSGINVIGPLLERGHDHALLAPGGEESKSDERLAASSPQAGNQYPRDGHNVSASR